MVTTSVADKAIQRRAELSAAAVNTLASRGYANTSLRDIAANSAYSHGIFHYYFESKDDLIRHAVRTYKTQCVRSYDPIIANAHSADEMLTGFAKALTTSLDERLGLHRLWYDLRTQTLFDDTFADDVRLIDDLLREMVWQVLCRYSELVGGEPAVDPDTAYALFDGIFERAVFDASSGSAQAGERLATRAMLALPGLVRP